MNNVRTDLALEARELYKEQALQKEDEVPGIEVDNQTINDIVVTRVKITTDEAAKSLNKPCGTYVTIESQNIRNGYNYEEICKVLSTEIRNIAKIEGKKENFLALVVGLGNRNITPDSIGPKTVGSVLVTRHLFSEIPEHLDDRLIPVCALSPGVLGITGIETVEIINSVVERVHPSLVIAIDALAARKIDRVSATIQIADTGISPGSGVGNRRQAINSETLGVPVIAIGVPTVSDAATIAQDTIQSVLESLSEEMNEGLKNKLVRGLLSPYSSSLMVTPKDIDQIAERVSKVLSGGINLALHNGLTLEEVSEYVS